MRRAVGTVWRSKAPGLKTSRQGFLPTTLMLVPIRGTIGVMSKTPKKQPRIRAKWTDETKFEFSTSRLRAYTYADRKKKASKEACRKKENW